MLKRSNFPVQTQARRQDFLREGAIQRGDGPNACWRREPLGGSGGMLPKEILKIRLSETVFRAFCSQYDMKTGSQKKT